MNEEKYGYCEKHDVHFIKKDSACYECREEAKRQQLRQQSQPFRSDPAPAIPKETATAYLQKDPLLTSQQAMNSWKDYTATELFEIAKQSGMREVEFNDFIRAHLPGSVCFRTRPKTVETETGERITLCNANGTKITDFTVGPILPEEEPWFMSCDIGTKKWKDWPAGIADLRGYMIRIPEKHKAAILKMLRKPAEAGEEKQAEQREKSEKPALSDKEKALLRFAEAKRKKYPTSTIPDIAQAYIASLPDIMYQDKKLKRGFSRDYLAKILRSLLKPQ